MGSGVCVAWADGTGLILSAEHVIHGASPGEPITVKFPNHGTFAATVAAADPAHDCCTLFVSCATKLPYTVVLPQGEAPDGAAIVKWAYPAGEFTYGRGEMRAGDETWNRPQLYVAPGDSGGGVLDLKGYVVGVITGYIAQERNTALTVRAGHCRSVVQACWPRLRRQQPSQPPGTPPNNPPTQPPADDPLAKFRERLDHLDGLLQKIEGKPAPDLAPINQRLQDHAGKLDDLLRRIEQNKPMPLDPDLLKRIEGGLGAVPDLKNRLDQLKADAGPALDLAGKLGRHAPILQDLAGKAGPLAAVAGQSGLISWLPWIAGGSVLGPVGALGGGVLGLLGFLGQRALKKRMAAPAATPGTPAASPPPLDLSPLVDVLRSFRQQPPPAAGPTVPGSSVSDVSAVQPPLPLTKHEFVPVQTPDNRYDAVMKALRVVGESHPRNADLVQRVERMAERYQSGLDLPGQEQQ